ncbi:hypothetical protein [Geodermatophilus marinus]|uniref:hypothetical protein n=1 Tax=Geodermatophilus sp. LHW52908 TaxID=2303986 RepID=UPI000E3B9E52|nr:hypothetical protein [Geodermatophilus sp. LHW52908]RFU21184.1 hypothetical protein D0Z06_12390 [Geodermatophilus sp. LHW52908]
MPTARRTAAALLAAVPLGVALVTGCTATGGDGDPAPAPPSWTRAGTIDLDTTVNADVRPHDLAADPTGGVVALVGSSDRSWLVHLGDDGSTVRREIPAAGPDAEVAVTPDGTAVVAGIRDGVLTVLTVPPGDAEPTPTTVATAATRSTLALSPDGGTLVAALPAEAGPAELVAVDVATGQVAARTAADVSPTHLVTGADGLTALAVRDGQPVLARFTADLRPAGDPVVLPGAPAAPAGLALTADGRAVASVAGPTSGRLVVVDGAEVTTEVELSGTEDSGLDLAVDADGRYAYVPLAAYQVEPGIVTVDLATGERIGRTVLCPGAGSLGAIAASGDTLVATGVCLGSGLTTTAFLLR